MINAWLERINKWLALAEPWIFCGLIFLGLWRSDGPVEVLIAIIAAGVVVALFSAWVMWSINRDAKRIHQMQSKDIR